jgi:hypothetical protein
LHLLIADTGRMYSGIAKKHAYAAMHAAAGAHIASLAPPRIKVILLRRPDVITF